jgi:hypothetical protein
MGIYAAILHVLLLLFPAAMFLGMAIPIALCRIPSHYFGVRLSVVCVLPALCVFAFCFAHMAHLGAPYDTRATGRSVPCYYKLCFLA